MPRRWARRALAALAWTTGVAAALLALPAKADAVADFYRGKTVTLVVGYGPGGGYDVYARLVGRHLGRHIPGNPDRRGAEHAGRGLAARRQLALQSRAAGRHRDRAFCAQHAADGHARHQQQRAVRSAQVHLARLVVELRQRRLHPDRAQRHPGEDHRRRAPAGRRAAGARRHRRGRDRQRRADHPARHHRPQRQAGRGLSRLRRAYSSPWSAARCMGAPPTSPRSRRSSRNGSSRTADSTCWCSSRARRGTRISRTCRRRASSRATRARAC